MVIHIQIALFSFVAKFVNMDLWISILIKHIKKVSKRLIKETSE